MKTKYYRLICLLAICGLFFLYRPTSLYAQPSVNLTMPKTDLIPGDSLVLDLEMKSEESSTPVNLYFSLEVGIFTFYMNQDLDFISDKIPVVSNFRPMDFKVRLYGPGSLLSPSIFGEVKIPENAQGSFIWSAEILDSTTGVSLGKSQAFFTISSAMPTTTSTTTSIPANRPPTATITANPKSGEAPLTVDFSATATDPDGDEVVSFFWNFGDGTTSSENNPTHTFSKPETYKVALTVIDEKGFSSKSSVEIEVTTSTAAKTIHWRITRKRSPLSDEEEDWVDSTWIIRFDRIEFQIIPIDSEIHFCIGGMFPDFDFVQGTKQFSAFGDASIEFEDGFSGCGTLRKGIIAKGTITGFPSWFDPMEPFTMFHDTSSIEVK